MTSKQFKTWGYQQNLSGLKISVVVMLAARNDVDDLRPLLPGVEQALASLRKLEKRCEWVADIQLEPTRRTVCVIIPAAARGAFEPLTAARRTP